MSRVRSPSPAPFVVTRGAEAPRYKRALQLSLQRESGGSGEQGGAADPVEPQIEADAEVIGQEPPRAGSGVHIADRTRQALPCRRAADPGPAGTHGQIAPPPRR